MRDRERHLEFIRTYWPPYLSRPLNEKFFADIESDFPFSTNPYKVYWLSQKPNVFLQGDVVIEIPISLWDADENTYQTYYFPSAILSNTCDISLANRRLEEANTLVAAVFTVHDYVNELRERRISQDRINSFLADLKANKISNLFYLPLLKRDTKVILEESFVRFDLAASLPISIFDIYDGNYTPDGDRVITLSNYGFYLFLFKLSIHFSRIREGVFRSA